MAGISDAPFIQKLAIPAVSLLIFFLGYSSQYLFHVAADLEPGPLTTSESRTFNAILLCLWWTYYKACSVDPGRYIFTSRVLEVPDDSGQADGKGQKQDRQAQKQQPKWCRKCSAPKPPRAHHCRTCRRCVPRMDHHCPWTTNCVSLTTLPHFLRFLLFANLGLWYLSTLLLARFAAIWHDRFLPAYLGPSLSALIHLSLLAIVNFFTCVGLGIMLFSTAKSWVVNMTMIEGWEAERHEEVLARAKKNGGTGRNGGWWDTGEHGGLPMEKVEFPYDIGFFANMAQAMGTRNPVAWAFPFSGNPEVAPTQFEGTGWEWEENGFNPRKGMWPPPDPDKVGAGGAARKWPGATRPLEERGGNGGRYGTREDEVEAFRKRQQADLKRWKGNRSRILAELEEVDDYEMVDDYHHDDDDDDDDVDVDDSGEATRDVQQPRPIRPVAPRPAWTNSEGERLRDFGVDEEAEGEDDDDDVEEIQRVDLIDDEDVPLAELIRRRKVRHHDGQEN